MFDEGGEIDDLKDGRETVSDDRNHSDQLGRLVKNDEVGGLFPRL